MLSAVSAETRILLGDRIATFDQLRVLLILHRTPEQAWTAESVARKLDLATETAAEALDHLCRHNLLDVRIGNATLLFRYSPGNGALDGAVRELAEVT